MDENLYELCLFWYFSQKQQFNINFNKLTSIDIYNQWINVWFAKEEKQVTIDSYLKKYEYMIETYINFSPRNLIETIGIIILYDQITRNIFRNTSNAYKYDKIALLYAKKLINVYERLHFCVKLTVIICLIHSENIVDHNNVQLKIHELVNDPLCDKNIFRSLYNISINHLERIVLFGRIPERNKFLSRTSTDEERAYILSL
jgi:uncharacterized protein (DUF924 family)